MSHQVKKMNKDKFHIGGPLLKWLHPQAHCCNRGLTFSSSFSHAWFLHDFESCFFLALSCTSPRSLYPCPLFSHQPSSLTILTASFCPCQFHSISSWPQTRDFQYSQSMLQLCNTSCQHPACMDTWIIWRIVIKYKFAYLSHVLASDAFGVLLTLIIFIAAVVVVCLFVCLCCCC